MNNRIITLVMVIFGYINTKLNNMFMTVVSKIKQTYREWKDVSFYRIANHCLYEHEMGNVSIYIKLPIAIIATTIAVLAIVQQANKGRYKPEQQ